MALSHVTVETLQAERTYTVFCTCKVMKLSTFLQRHCQAERSWQLVCCLAVDLVWRCQVLQLEWGSKQVSGFVWYSYMYFKTSSMRWHVHCKHSQHANTKSKHSAATQMTDVIDTSFASCLLLPWAIWIQWWQRRKIKIKVSHDRLNQWYQNVHISSLLQ